MRTRALTRDIEPIGYNLEEMSEALRIHPETLAKLLREGVIPGRKIGREWRISPRAVEDWLASGDGAPEAASDD
ncbi:helix-turn-helix domain-containing protein [Nitratidesulfovibrio vulgaris]|uniref:DNA binding domain, excisionase family n=1 Tax=Nitratidesulfovibrio vulgaris (strain DP4) TaxID=391774 RepID=A0A0H3A492_NITV4|nr:helix-turn-helix domain-containing protein [Nitratidesulfovibrio vulgaris]ABM27109.1 DNA binding domain, excisionase family [Nitratidesulfovibrio vulgaris DP4]